MSEASMQRSALAEAGTGRRRLVLSERAAWLIVAVVAVVLGRYFWRSEGLPSNVLFTAGVTATIAAVLTLATRRVLFGVGTTAVMVAVIVAVATVKRQAMNMVVHAYDIFFYFSSWSTVSFLWSDYRRHLVGLVAALVGLVLAAWLLYRVDATRIRRAHAGAAVLVFALLAAIGAQTKGERRHMQFYFENLLVSSFYASWAETLETFWRGQLVEAAAQAPGPKLSLPGGCAPATKPPHIVLIHQESVVPPSLFKGLDYDRNVDPFFVSFDGRPHPMRVETYGGASWLTEFSILTGLSTHSFGGMRQFVQSVMEGKVRDTLPQALARCGYRNVVFYPMLKNFVSNARFYDSVGLKEIFDSTAQKAKRHNERDRFYYGNALDEMERHLKSSPAPLFTFVQTMATHWPYDIVYSPEEKVAGGGLGTHPEMHEYLRRLALAKIDYDWLLAELKRRFPSEPILILHYGDHQPTPTRLLLGFDEDADAEDVVLEPNSIGFMTYYAVDALNFRPRPLPKVEALDVPYLGTVLLHAAGLPLSDSYRERMRLLDLCRGLYHGCTRREEVLEFHRRLIDSGLMDAR
jgi:hypothetical protein